MPPKNKGHSYTRLKYCGITRSQDVAMAVRLGVDFLGFNFWQGSKRFIAPAEARLHWQTGLVARPAGEGAPQVPKTFGILVNPSHSEIETVLQSFPDLDGLQFHGTETVAFITEVSQHLKPRFPSLALWKAVPIAVALDLDHAKASAQLVNLLTPWRDVVDLLLLDAAPQTVAALQPQAWGGLGLSFDWYLLKDPRVGQILSSMPWGLAGGIKASNLTAALTLNPDLIDVCSGIESSPGVKDPVKSEALWRQVYRQRESIL